MSTVPGIYRKLHSIMSEANYIQKDKKNPHFGYSYASEAAIKEKLHELFVKHGVLPTFSSCNQQVVEIGRNDKGKGRYRTTLDLTYRFFDVEDGSSVEGTMSGAGVDDEDKGTYKAITGALKYCLTSQFIIPTGDDPENENGERTEKKPARRESKSTTIGQPAALPQPLPTPQGGDIAIISEPQRKRFYAIYNNNGWSDEEVKLLLADFGIHSGKHIPKADYEKLCHIVENQTYAVYLDFKNTHPAA